MVKNFFKNAGLMVGSVLVLFVVLEIAARVVLAHTSDVDRFLTYASRNQLQARADLIAPYLRYQPHRYLGYIPTPNYRAETINNRHNALGFRDDEIVMPKPAGQFRIACLGGSTTYTPCVGDYRYSYPNCLERELHERGYTNVDVINAAADGWTSYETLINLSFRVLDLDPDMIIVLDSVNDVWARIVWPHSAYHGDNSGFRSAPTLDAPRWYEHSTLVRGILIKMGLAQPQSMLFTTYDTWHGETFHALEYESQIQRGTYPSGVFKDVPLGDMLKANPPIYFRRNLQNIARLARANGVQVVLATLPFAAPQPGDDGDRPLVASSEFHAAMDETNAIVKEVAGAEGAVAFDFASVFPTDPALYQDGLHVNFEGVRLMGKTFADFLAGSDLIPRQG